MSYDEHCHIVPDVDDGSRSLSESAKMVEAAARAGITAMTCTPHMRWSDFDQDKVKRNYQLVDDIARRHGIRTRLGYEVFYGTLLKRGVDQAPRFVTEGTGSILIEFDTAGPCVEGWEHVFYRIQTQLGLDITVAHPERYTTVWEDFDTVYRMLDMGCRVQVSAEDLFAGHAMGKCAKRIVKEGLCDALVSDAHCPEHYAAYAKALKKYGKYLLD